MHASSPLVFEEDGVDQACPLEDPDDVLNYIVEYTGAFVKDIMV